MINPRFFSIVALLAAGYLVACEHQDNSNVAAVPDTSAKEYGVTSAQAATADARVVDRLAEARCSQERSCHNVGDGKKYASNEVCMNQMRGSIGNDLNAYNCRGGIDSAQLEHCAASIQEEQCDRPLDTISRMDKCSANRLCLK